MLFLLFVFVGVTSLSGTTQGVELPAAMEILRGTVAAKPAKASFVSYVTPEVRRAEQASFSAVITTTSGYQAVTLDTHR